MGARDDHSRPEQPRAGLIDRWLAQRGDPPAADADDVEAAAVAGAAPTARDSESVPGTVAPDPVLMAKLAALRATEESAPATPEPPASETAAPHPRFPRSQGAAEPEPGSLKDRLAARRAQLGQVRRDAGAAVLSALETKQASDPEPTTLPTVSDPAPQLPPSADEDLPAPAPEVAPDDSAADDETDAKPTAIASDIAEADEKPTPRRPDEAQPASARPGTDERRARLAQMVRRRVVSDVEDARPEIPADPEQRGPDKAASAAPPDAAAPDAAPPDPAPAAPASETVDATPAATSEPRADDEIDVIAALRQLPMTSAEATSQQRPEHGRHKGPSTGSAPTSEPRDDAADPALQAALRAVETAERAGEGKAAPQGRRGTAPEPEARVKKSAPSGQPTVATPGTPSTPDREEPARRTARDLDPTIAAALRASMGIEEPPAAGSASQAGAPHPPTPPTPEEKAPRPDPLDAADLLDRVSRSADQARARRATPSTPAPVQTETPRPASAQALSPAPRPAATTVKPPAAQPAPAPAEPPVAQPPPAEPTPTAPAAEKVAEVDDRHVTAPTSSAAPVKPSPSPTREDRGLRAPTRDVNDAPTSSKAPPGVVQFRRRRSTRQLLGMLALLCFLGTVGTGFLAWDTRGTTEIAIACTLAVMTLILWSAFSTAAPATLTLDRGLLDIVSKESRHRFDLASPYTEITVKGRPGKRNWQVQIHRRSMKPFVIDSSMVDPEEFQPVLEHYREIADEAAAANERRREQR